MIIMGFKKQSPRINFSLSHAQMPIVFVGFVGPNNRCMLRQGGEQASGRLQVEGNWVDIDCKENRRLWFKVPFISWSLYTSCGSNNCAFEWVVEYSLAREYCGLIIIIEAQSCFLKVVYKALYGCLRVEVSHRQPVISLHILMKEGGMKKKVKEKKKIFSVWNLTREGEREREFIWGYSLLLRSPLENSWISSLWSVDSKKKGQKGIHLVWR